MATKSQFGLKEEIKKILRPLIYKIPNKYRYGKEYRDTYRYLIKNSYNNISLENDLKELLKYAIKNVTFYKEKVLNKKKLEEFPIISKKDIFSNETNFISKEYNIKKLKKFSTGGTTGFSLNLYKNKVEISREVAYVDYLFYKIVEKNNYIKGVLRSENVENGFYKEVNGTLIFSAYKLTKDNIKEYLEIMNEKKVECLHILPSAMKIFCKYIEINNLKPNIPSLKGILSSSEVLSIKQKKEILNIFPEIKLLDLYGHTEHLNFAVSENLGAYNFFKKYGYTEFRIVEEKEETKIAEIIATGFNNRAMPLIRYKTDDYVELNSKNEVISILGRKQDFLIDKNDNIIPCIFDTREDTLKNVENFQFYQPEKGKLIFRIVILNSYNKNDEKVLYEDLNYAFGQNLDIEIKVVEKIEKTKNGKQRRLIQDFKLDDYWSVENENRIY